MIEKVNNSGLQNFKGKEWCVVENPNCRQYSEKYLKNVK
jgi:hypothetical protein